jgi:hypothetical protein
MTVTLTNHPGAAPAGSTSVGQIPLVRLHRPPRLEPPCDDDRPPSGAAETQARPPDADGAGAAVPPGSGRAAVSGAAEVSGAGAEGVGPEAEPGARARQSPSRVRAGGDPVTAPARRAAHRYVAACLEVLGGFRPISHLRPLTCPIEFEAVAAQLVRSAGGGRSATARPGSGMVRPVADRIRLRHLRICEPRTGVIEAAAVLGQGERVWAMTLRLELRVGTWICTHLQVV